MIIENTNKVSTNLTDSTEFSVSENSAKIFSFLSNFLYKDKERSVITELCSNALDAHKMVGNEDKPILVQLPTDLQREFRVRDFGPGLSHGDVFKFLTKYGESSKTTSNDFIGGFGIGSKSPASVTDTWTINSHHDGVMASYLIHVNEKNIPSINQMFTLPTSESGLEVVIPVKSTREWHDAARATFEHYEVLPDIKGATMPFIRAEVDTDYFGEYYTVRGSCTTDYDTHNIVAVVNRRAYIVDRSKFSATIANMEFNTVIYVNFGIGQLSVSLSREDLQYDSKTIAAITSRLTYIHSCLVDAWRNEVSNKSSIFEYQLAASDFKKKYRVCADTLHHLAEVNQDKYFENVNFDYLNKFTLSLGTTPIAARAIQLVSSTTTREIVQGRASKVDLNRNYKGGEYSLSFTANSRESIIFVLKDDNFAPSRIRNAIKTGVLSDGVILLSQDIFDKIPDDFYKVKASDYDKPERVKRVKGATIKSDLYNLDGRRFVKVEESAIDTTEETVCVKFKLATTSGSIVGSSHSLFCHQFGKFANVIYVKEGTASPAWAITPEEWAKKEYDAIVSMIPDMVAKLNYDKVNSILSQYQYHNQSYRMVAALFSTGRYKDFIGQQTAVGVACHHIAAHVAYVGNKKLQSDDLYSKMVRLANWLNVDDKSIPRLDIDNSVNEWATMYDAYPMLKMLNLSSSFSAAELDDLLVYVALTGK